MNPLSVISLLNEWQELIGATVGALIGGGIAYCISISNINQMRRKEESEKICKFFKIYEVLNPLLERTIILLNNPVDKNERYPIDLPQETLINHMLAHISCESNAKNSKNKDDLYMAYHHLKRVMDINDDLKNINETIKGLREEFIPYEFYKNYHDLIQALTKIINMTNKFLYHDEGIPKDAFPKKLNAYHDIHSNNDVIQIRITQSDAYSECVMTVHEVKERLEELFQEKNKELAKLRK